VKVEEPDPDMVNPFGKMLLIRSELQETRAKLANAQTKLDEAAVAQTLLAKEKMSRKMMENKVKQLQDEIRAISSFLEKAKCSEVQVQTLSPILSQKSTQTDQKRSMEHASMQTEPDNTDPTDVAPNLEELRRGEIENKSASDQPKLAHAEELAEKQDDMRVSKLMENSELENQRLVHEHRLTEVYAELHQLRSEHEESKKAFQRQREGYAEQLAELRGEMESRKIEALAAQFPTASKLLIAAYVRLETLGKRKRDDGE